MKYLITINLLFFTLASISQNLVPNPSFEYYTSCTTGPGQLSLATPWFGSNGIDYLNSCSSNPLYSVPNQGDLCFQYAHSGNAFIAIFVYNGIDNNYREYAQVSLFSSLQPNSCYYVEFYVNLASSAWGGKYAVNNITCSFTNTSASSTGNVLNLTPYIYKLGNPVINDTLNWVKISGIYQATGGEQYIVIGNFKDDSHTDTLNTGDGDYPGSTYFIDDVSVIPVDSLNMPAYAGHDASITAGDSVFIGQEITNLDCNWYTNGQLITSGVSGLYVSPTESTTYVVEQNLCGTITYDTVLIKVNHMDITENDAMENLYRIYPNPGKDFIILQSEQLINGNIYIINNLGLVVKEEEIKHENEKTIDIRSLPAGLYLLRYKEQTLRFSVVK